MTTEEIARLVCPNHAGEEPRFLEELPCDERTVKCPDCGERWQNFIKYPVALIHDVETGEMYRKNVLTGERVD